MRQDRKLPLERCPHCNVAKPNMTLEVAVETCTHQQTYRRNWVCYGCETCGGVVLTCAVWSEVNKRWADITNQWPSSVVVDEAVPGRAKQFLEQAISSIHAPAGAVMLTGSAVDAMLKEKGLKTGSLYTRIKAAAEQHLITAEMATWAHEVRLDANDQRHADEDAELPDETDARKTIDFALALAQFLFVLPARVERGREDARK